MVRDAAEFGTRGDTAKVRLEVRLENSPGRASWVVTVWDRSLMDAIERGMAEQLAALVRPTGFEKPLIAETRARIETWKSASAKFEHAFANPVTEPEIVCGVLQRADSSWRVVADSSAVSLDALRLGASPAPLLGREVVARGVRRGAGQFEVYHFAQRSRNTLDLFVMSLCPYGKQAETSLIHQVQNLGGAVGPALRIHYILYLRDSGDGQRFASLRGEEEVAEDVVQMLIRDKYPAAYWPYLLLRAESARPWEELAAQVGLRFDDVAELGRQSVAERESILRREFDLVAGSHGIYDGSPTILWEGLPLGEAGSVSSLSVDSIGLQHCLSPH
jgi:hypothetical protein